MFYLFFLAPPEPWQKACIVPEPFSNSLGRKMLLSCDLWLRQQNHCLLSVTKGIASVPALPVSHPKGVCGRDCRQDRSRGLQTFLERLRVSPTKVASFCPRGGRSTQVHHEGGGTNRRRHQLRLFKTRRPHASIALFKGAAGTLRSLMSHTPPVRLANEGRNPAYTGPYGLLTLCGWERCVALFTGAVIRCFPLKTLRHLGHCLPVSS